MKKVLLGLSGGVDSAVSAILLKKQGFEVIGAFMKNYSETKNEITGECSYLEDKKDALKIASKLNIPLIILDFEKEYKKKVIREMFNSYKEGLTPNPDSLCNKIIKFPFLWKEAKKRGIDYIATGHYIKKIKNKDNSWSLRIPADKNKDQSYFLYDLTQKDLEHTLFPIGEKNLTKSEVRAIAKTNKLHNYDKKGSRGICFIGKTNFKSFLKSKIKQKEGKVIDPEGNIIGTHKGIFYYTIGERIGESKNILINNNYRNKVKSKLYIADKNLKSNVLKVAPEKHPSLLKKQFKVIKINWINKVPRFPSNVKVRIRHLGPLISAKIERKDDLIILNLKKSILGLAEGQSCVIYKNSEVLGGGEIRY